MKFVIVFAVVAAWVSSSEAQQPVTCERVTECTPDLSALQGADGSKEDIQKACAAIQKALSCFREAMADCRENKNIPEATINSLEQQMNTYDTMLEGQCDGAGAAGTVEKVSVLGALAMSFLALFL